MSLWTRDEAYAYLNERFRMEEASPEEAEAMISRLMAMKHRPWCRRHLRGIAPEYGSECTCDGEDKS